MLKIKDGVDLKELEKFGFEKIGGTEKCWYFYYYTKKIYGLINSYLINIDGYTREIKQFEDLTANTSFNNLGVVNKKRLIKDLIKADFVEKVDE